MSAPTGGTWTITYNGETTSGLSYSASASEVHDALEALTGLSGKITVEVNATGAFPAKGGGYRITFDESMGDPAGEITLNDYLLGADTPTLTPSTYTPWAAGESGRNEIIGIEVSYPIDPGGNYTIITPSGETGPYDQPAPSLQYFADMIAAVTGWTVVGSDGSPVVKCEVTSPAKTDLGNCSLGSNTTNGTIWVTNVQDGAPDGPGTSEVQDIVLDFAEGGGAPGANTQPTGGTWTITVSNYGTTAPLDFDASTAEVQAALQDISGLYGLVSVDNWYGYTFPTQGGGYAIYFSGAAGELGSVTVDQYLEGVEDIAIDVTMHLDYVEHVPEGSPFEISIDTHWAYEGYWSFPEGGSGWSGGSIYYDSTADGCISALSNSHTSWESVGAGSVAEGVVVLRSSVRGTPATIWGGTYYGPGDWGSSSTMMPSFPSISLSNGGEDPGPPQGETWYFVLSFTSGVLDTFQIIIAG
jgi:hypothetical protein